MPTPDNIIMMKCRTPKKIELRDSRVFFARFKRVTREIYLRNIRMRRRYRQRAKPWGRQCRCHEAVQRGWGLNIGGLLRVVFGL